MDRRSFLQITGATAVAGVPLPAGAGASQLVDDHEAGAQFIHAAWASSDPVLGPLASRLARRLTALAATERASPLADALTSEPEHLVLAPADQRADVDPALYLAAPLPLGLGFAPADHIAWLAIGGGQPLWDEIGRRAGFKPIAVAYAGSRPGLWSRRPLDGPDALTGRAVAARGLVALALETVGARVVGPLSIDIASALTQDILDIAQPTSLEHAMALGLPNIASYMAPDGFDSGCLIALHVPVAIWDGMSATQRDLVEAVAAHELQLSLASARAHEALLQRMIATTPGIVIKRLNPALHRILQQRATIQVDALTSADPLARRLQDSLTAFHHLTGARDSIHSSAPMG